MSEENKQQDRHAKWLQVSPLDTPKISLQQLPKHNPKRFEEYTEIIGVISSSIKNDQGEEETINKEEIKGFKLLTGEVFEFDSNKGWVDEYGCYYNEDAEPQGWKVYDIVDGTCQEHYYDKYGQYVPTDLEDDEEEQDDDEDDEYLNQDKEKIEPHIDDDDNDDDSIEHELKQYKLDDEP